MGFEPGQNLELSTIKAHSTSHRNTLMSILRVEEEGKMALLGRSIECGWRGGTVPYLDG